MVVLKLNHVSKSGPCYVYMDILRFDQEACPQNVNVLVVSALIRRICSTDRNETATNL